ncbi:hypothetical protein ACCAA_770017 [Candidatus Accumulibacter aalborgensis]|uniref:Uncharacterized protein n=1 Tax=Candidatus Accumulibacter aalborgensis TaxID=1860102 RepID=A0A1A8XXV0_9PROT|nr:hypothetical protein ACCAA_770017 [Candidatus Accumulibacter aalborgensis]
MFGWGELANPNVIPTLKRWGSFLTPA